MPRSCNPPKQPARKCQARSQKASRLNPHPEPANATCSDEEIMDPREAVEEFFSSAPPILEKGEGHTDSPGTRPPKDFDIHLHPDLILHRVVNVPLITSDLLAIAQDALDSYIDLPLIQGSLFPTAERREAVYETEVDLEHIRVEKDIRLIYNKTTARFCEVVAGTLAFQLPQWSGDGLNWTMSNANTRHRTGEAQCDDPGIEHIQRKIPAGANADGFLKLRKNKRGRYPIPEDVVHKFPVLAVWEFKNMNADSKVMNSIVTEFLACERFPWQGCGLGEDCICLHETICCRTGFDAEESIFPPIPAAGDSMNVQYVSDVSPTLPDNTFLAFPRHVLQQVWAQAVKHDATYMVIHSGNCEIICKRSRGKQTLYLSNVFHVHDPNYFKLHTGLYIAALRDAEQRALLLNHNRPLPHRWTFCDLLDVSGEELQGRIRHLSRSRDLLSMCQVDVQSGRDHFIPNSLYKRDSPSPLPVVIAPDNLVKIQIYGTAVKATIMKGSLRLPGVSFRGVPDARASVLVKTAEGKADVEALKYEYKVHVDLNQEGVKGIAKIIGFYEHRNLKKNGDEAIDAALVMEDLGRTVAQYHQDGHKIPFLSRAQLNQYQGVLHEIHRCGYTHRGLTFEALWIRGERDSCDVSLAGFAAAVHKSRCGPLDHSRSIREDQEKLLQLVPNLLTRKLVDEEPNGPANHNGVRSKSEPLLGSRPSKLARDIHIGKVEYLV